MIHRHVPVEIEAVKQSLLQTVCSPIIAVPPQTRQGLNQAPRSRLNHLFQHHLIETRSSALKSDLQIAIRDVKLWTGKVAIGAIAIIITVITAAIRFVGHG